MEKSKTKISYSIIRYSPDEIRGEVLNIGVLLYNFEEKETKYQLLEESSQKLKAVTDNKTGVELYRSYKEVLEYYLTKSKDDLSGVVGDLCIASYFDEGFLDKLYEQYKDCKLSLSKPNIAYTRDIDKLFTSILNRYVGEKFVTKEITTMTAKKYMKKIFEDTKLLGEKVKLDMILNPIEELEDLQVKVDFSFKNGIWNYMQTIPSSNNPNKNMEWFAKTELILKTIDNNDAKIHLLYKNSELTQDIATHNLIRYLVSKNDNKITVLDIEKKDEVDNLCNYIKEQGQPLETLQVS